MFCVMRAFSRKRSGMNGSAKSGHSRVHGRTATDLERRTAAYPEEIAHRLIRMFSVKGELVLDPFLGSGTTTKIAIQNERNSIGYETDRNLATYYYQKDTITILKRQLLK